MIVFLLYTAFSLGAQRLLNGIEKGFIMAFGKLDIPYMKACYSAEWVFYLICGNGEQKWVNTSLNLWKCLYIKAFRDGRSWFDTSHRSPIDLPCKMGGVTGEMMEGVR